MKGVGPIKPVTPLRLFRSAHEAAQPASNVLRSPKRTVIEAHRSTAFLSHSIDNPESSFSPPLPFRFVFCYHAATRTGQPSPIIPHVGSVLVCGFLWG